MILLIASGAYITQELVSEFGRLPPAFLPIGNKRLLEWQLALNDGRFDRVFITLPQDFALDASDLQLLEEHQVTIIRVEPSWSLGASIGHALQIIQPEAPLSLLYGDTLVGQWPRPTPGQSDWIGVGQTTDNYDWYVESSSPQGHQQVWIGAFHFAQPRALMDGMHQHGGFIAAVDHYAESRAAQKIPVPGWLDFGHVHTYYKSRTQITTQRAFNELKIVDGVVYKQSQDQKKMRAESDWLEFAPHPIKKYLPAHYGKILKANEPQGYASEYLTYPSLADLFVFGRLPASTWKEILHSCKRFIETIATLDVEGFDAGAYGQHIYADKTHARLVTFSADTGIHLDRPWCFNGRETPSLTDMAQDCIDHVLRSGRAQPSIIHGDFCFSNVLYDFRSARIKAIDPRGMNAHGEISPHGDLRYEMAKLSHSVVGLYDFIVADRFSMTQEGPDISFVIDAPHVRGVQDIFSGIQFKGKRPTEWDCMPIMVLLFLSMLPLHHDSRRRQAGLMANAMRLYLDWKGDAR